MALNFPPVDAGDGNPTDGMVWTAPNGRQWMYDVSLPGWKSLSATGNSNIVYRGGIDPNQDPNAQYADIVSGNEFITTATVASIDGAFYPGLAGSVAALYMTNVEHWCRIHIRCAGSWSSLLQSRTGRFSTFCLRCCQN